MALKLPVDGLKDPTWTTDSDSNADAVVTLAAPASDRANVVDQVIAGFDDDPAAAVVLTITDGTKTLYFPITKGGLAPVPLHAPFIGAKGAAVTITLPAGGSGVTGYLNVASR